MIIASKMKTVIPIYIFSGWDWGRTIEGHQFFRTLSRAMVDHGPNSTRCPYLLKKTNYWNRTMPIHLLVACDCFCAQLNSMTEIYSLQRLHCLLSSPLCNRYGKCLLNSAVEQVWLIQLFKQMIYTCKWTLSSSKHLPH